jgi:IPT/TIG domain-containing protein
VAGLILSASSCGKSPTAPSTALGLSSISPSQGSTTGGTNISINGANFANDATVTVGGVVATSVALQSSSVLTAVVGEKSGAGAADVVVTSGGHSATLSRAFTFVAPSGTNLKPMIAGVRSVGSHPNQPTGFGDQDETVTLIATVSDAETPTSSLVSVWTGPGTFSASEPITIWHLPSTVSPIPSPITATLTVTENYVEGSVTHRNVSTFPFVMQVHDSQKEILDMGEDFLTLFSQSQISSTDVLHNFSTTCDRGSGYSDEKGDTDSNRTYLREDFSKFTIARLPPVFVNFGGRCPFRSRLADACSQFRVHWEVTYIKAIDNHKVGDHETTNGIDYVTAVLENNRWRLCHSDFDGIATNPLTGISRHVEW